MIDKEIIKKNFSRCAPYYDKYSTIQNLCALRLIARIQANNFANILEVGCGTGNYTKLLREKFPQAKIKAIDISFKMIRWAKGKIHQDSSIEFIVADGETAYFKQGFDLISSNATFQWFEDLEGALLKYRDLLKKNGFLFFSLFGPFTLFELNESLRELLGKTISISSLNFIEKEKIKKVLQRTFSKVEVEAKIYKERYNSLPQLLKKIKYTGVRGSGIEGRRFWTSKTVHDLERIYKKKFKDIVASYEVFFCEGLK